MKFFNKINKAIATTVLSAGILTTSICGVNLLNNARNYTVYATPYGEQTISKITDNDFHNFSGTTYGTPSSWSVADGSDTANKERFVSGIMNLTSSTAWNSNYEENFKLEESQNPDDGSTTDKQYLYINNFSTTPVKYGYVSENFDFSNNSFYSISVQVKTITSNGQSAKASIYLSGLDDNDVKMENINTDGAWQNYTFYVATNSIKSSSGLKLELWLGSKTSGSYGAMFVNVVQVKQYDESTFNSLSDKDSSTSVYKNLNQKVSIPFSNNGFENALTGWTVSSENSNDSENAFIGSVKVGTGYNSNVYTNQWNATNPYTINTFNNEYALLISNKTDLITGIESASITIKQHGLYKLSVWAYSNCDTGNGATIIAKEIGAVGSDLAYTTLNVSTKTSSTDVTSNWVEYNIYVQGNAFKDTSIKLGLFLGTPAIADTEANPTSGYVYFDEVRIQELSYEEYSEGISNSSNSSELNITPASSSFVVPNNRFNKAKNEDNSITYPLAPQNYTKKVVDINGNEVSNVTTTSGIVNLNSTHFTNNKSNYGEANNPGTFDGKNVSETTNNVLMIGTTNPIINQTYTSDSFTLSQSSYYKVSVWVQTQIYPEYDGGASITLFNGSNYIFKKEKINTHDTWQQIIFFIKTGSAEITSTFELGLKQTNGCVFFDELFIEKYESEAIFNSIITSSDKVIDLTYETFDTENTFKGYFDSSVTNASAKDNLTSGVTELNGNNALFINSNGSDVYYSFSSSNSYSLTEGSYYKLSVDVYTLNLNQEEENKKYDDEDLLIPYGATLQLKNSSGTFNKYITGINTALVNEGENRFTTYTFYICANESVDVYLYLSLGFTDALTCGQVYFDNIKFDSTLTEDQFNEAKNNYANEKTSLFVNDTTTTDEDADETTEEDTENEPFEFPWVLVSSLITGLAIIIALVGYFIRKVNFHKTPKVKTNYDRRKTLDVELDRKERIKMRQSMIEELKLQLHTIDDEIEALKEMFDAKEAQILINEKAKKEQIEKDKQAIIAERNDATKEYKQILASTATDKEKQIAERNFARYIAKLNKHEEKLQKLLDQKETASALLKIKREQQLQRFIDAQIAISKEIAKIEEEIEQIAKEDEQVWAEYKQAKMEAKINKTAYLQEKKLEKAEAKANKKSSKAKKETKKDLKLTENNNDAENNNK